MVPGGFQFFVAIQKGLLEFSGALDRRFVDRHSQRIHLWIGCIEQDHALIRKPAREQFGECAAECFSGPVTLAQQCSLLGISQQSHRGFDNGYDLLAEGDCAHWRVGMPLGGDSQLPQRSIRARDGNVADLCEIVVLGR